MKFTAIVPVQKINFVSVLLGAETVAWEYAPAWSEADEIRRMFDLDATRAGVDRSGGRQLPATGRVDFAEIPLNVDRLKSLYEMGGIRRCVNRLLMPKSRPQRHLRNRGLLRGMREIWREFWRTTEKILKFARR